MASGVREERMENCFLFLHDQRRFRLPEITCSSTPPI